MLAPELLASAEIGAVRAAARQVGCRGLWLVGGSVRDAVLGRRRVPPDLDLAVPENGRPLARELARALGGSAFALDEEQGAWRVDRGERGTVDVIPLRAPDLEGDLEGRDFTINAVAVDLLGGCGTIDPCGGLDDLRRRRLRLCSPEALDEDPVRVLRAYRFAAMMKLHMADSLPGELGRAAEGLGRVARERVRDEWFALLDSGRAAPTLEMMWEHGVLVRLFPFIEAWKNFDQGSYHSFDLLEHAIRTAGAAEELAREPERFPFLPQPERLRAYLKRKWQDGITRRALMVMAALMHDVAKPATVSRDGNRLRFLSHEVCGGERIYELLAELRVGKRAARAAQRLVAAHLRLFQLSRQQPPTARARLRYLRDLRRELPEAVLLSLADERATGPASPAWPEVSRTAGEVLDLYWQRWDRQDVPPLVRGRDLMEMGVPEGPQVGNLLRRIEAWEREGRVRSREEALARVREQLAGGAEEER